jgi:hypothetical protein
MSEYRYYCLGKDGRITRGEFLFADDDATALELVRDRHEPTVCELWSGSRQVAIIPPDDDAAGSDPPEHA